jgi:hypothetical protein
MTTNEQIGRPPGSAVTPCVLLSPHEAHGAGDWQSSWWCPGVTGPQTPEDLLAELEAATVVELTTQDELLTALDELLDNALHADGCYIGPEDTVCFCVISKIRAVLPRCEVTRPTAVIGTSWRCERTAHPASPDRHTFGAV